MRTETPAAPPPRPSRSTTPSVIDPASNGGDAQVQAEEDAMEGQDEDAMQEDPQEQGEPSDAMDIDPQADMDPTRAPTVAHAQPHSAAGLATRWLS